MIFQSKQHHQETKKLLLPSKREVPTMCSRNRVSLFLKQQYKCESKQISFLSAMRITRKIKLVMKPLENNIMKGCCLKKVKGEKTYTIRQSNDIYETHLQKGLET